MKKSFIAGLALIGLAAMCSAGTISLGNVSLSPGGTFLDQSANDTCAFATASGQCSGASFFAPTFIDLLSLSTPVHPGDTLSLLISGSICYIGSTCITPNLGGVFSSGPASLLDSTHQNRVQGSIHVPGSGYSTQTFFSLDGTTGSPFDNTNPDDFMIPGGSLFNVVVPTGAQFLVIGVYDSFYADNSGNITIGLSVDPPALPEPGTYMLIGAGLAATALLRKLRA